MNLKGTEMLFILVLLALFAFAIWLAIWIGKKADEKGYSRVGFTIFGLFFTIVALIIVLVIPPSQAAQMAGMVKCPHCAESVQPEANVCKHCGRDIPTAVAP